MTETPTVRIDPQRRALEAQLNTQLPNRVDRLDVLQRAHGGPKDDPHGVWPVETLRKAVEVEMPVLLAEKAAQAREDAARKSHEARHQHRDRLDRIKAAIKAGLGMTDRGEGASAADLAQAQAQADAEAAHEALAAEGEKARVKAEAALAKTRAEAIAKAKANLPVEPPELDELEAKAIAAIDALRTAIRSYAGQIGATRRDLAEAGVVAQGFNVSQEGIDWANHWHADTGAVTLDGVEYNASTVAQQRFSRIVTRAIPSLAQGGAYKYLATVGMSL
jgi:hypothetical protein